MNRSTTTDAAPARPHTTRWCLAPIRTCLRLLLVLALLVPTLTVGTGLMTPAPAAAAASTSAFRDIAEAGAHRSAVEALAELGVLNGTGCDPERLCPQEPLPRWAMAVWIVRARQLPGLERVSGSRFVDVDAHLWWARHVEVLAQAGITAGCATGPARYCPEQPVNRAQTASFLVRTFGDYIDG